MIQYQCPRCGRQFTTAQPSYNLRCPYCGNEFQIAYQQPPSSPYGYGPQRAYGAPGQMPVGDIGVFDVGPSGKSRGVAGLLAILLGPLGVHYFYLGKPVGGLVCLLVSLIGSIMTCGLAAGVVLLFTLVQGIMMMSMRSDEFEQKYVYSTSSMPLF